MLVNVWVELLAGKADNQVINDGQPTHLTFCCPSYGGESVTFPQPREIDQVWQMCSGLLPRLILTI